MRKNTKAILVFLCALVMVLTGIGMPVASAATTLDGLTVDYIFDSLGDAVNYGIVAKTWHQEKHAESNACVDILDKVDIGNGFANSNNTYAHITVSSVAASITSPNSLAGMTFALYKEAGTGYALCAGTEQTVASGNTAELTWTLDSSLYNQQLHVFLKSGDSYVPDNGVSEGLVINYGPAVFVGAANGNYLGKILLDQGYDLGKEINVFNTTEYFPSIVLGPETDIYVLDSENEPVPLDWDAEPSAQAKLVYVNYYYIDKATNTEKMGYAKLNGLYYKNGQFMKGTDSNSGIVHISKIDANKAGYAGALVDNSKTLSTQLANMGGGTIDPEKGTKPNATGSSTVTGPVDTNGNIVSIYDVEVGEDWLLKWEDDLGVAALPVADNEYVIVNVICPSSGVDASGNRTGILKMATDAGDLNYFIEGKEGKVQCGWGASENGGDRNASQRVIYNIVYADENGILQPYQGTIYPHSCHGGTILAPEAYLETNGEVHNGAMIVEEVRNDDQELHGRMLAQKERSTWVIMNGGYLTLQKASLGYNWNAGQYGQWEDQSNKDGISLADAVFGIYSDEDCDEDSLVATMTTDAEGKATSELISAGTYWVKEITPPKDHNLSDTVVEVTVVAGTEPTQVVGGGYFRENGGHWEGSGWNQVWVPHYDEIIAEEKFVNQQNNGYTSLRLVKTDEFGNLLPGAEFGVYTTPVYEQTNYYPYYVLVDCENQIGTAKTNRNGVAVFEDVPLRQSEVTYYIKETEAPAGYEKSETIVAVTLDKDEHRDKLVTIDADYSDEDMDPFVNQTIRGNIALKKVDAADGKLLSGAVFTVYDDPACGEDNIVGTMTTVDGIATSVGIDNGKDLLPGTYYVVETKAPEGYKAPTEKNNWNQDVPRVYTVTVQYGKTVNVLEDDEGNPVAITNEQVVSFYGTKVWKDEGYTNQRPNEIRVNLLKNQDTNPYRSVVVSAATEWKFAFENLPRFEKGEEITYTIKEDLVGKGNDYHSYVGTPDKDGNLTIVNSIKRTKLVVMKAWEDKLENIQRPNQVTYLLFQKVGDTLEMVPGMNGEPQMKSDAYAYNGYRAEFTNLPNYNRLGDPAEYVVKEAESDDFALIGDPVITKNENNQNANEYTYTLTNRLTVPLKGTKTWVDSSNADGKRPEDIELHVFCKDDEKPDGKRKVYPDGPDAIDGIEIIWDKETNPDVWSWKVIGLPRYDAAGNECSYTVNEVRVPGYKVTVSDDGLNFTNTKTGNLELYKVAPSFNGQQPLRGAEFKLYYDLECKNPVPGQEKTTDHRGFADFRDLAPGDYYLKEEKAPDFYELMAPNPLKVTVLAGKTVRVNGEDGVIVDNWFGTSTEVTLPVTKELQTAHYQIDVPEDLSKTFEFAIEADEATAKVTGWDILKDKAAVTVTGTGSVTTPDKDAFSIKFTQVGTYTFEVKETTPGTGNIKADDTVYTVTYTVTAGLYGRLHAEETIYKNKAEAYRVHFVNTYGYVDIEGDKVWQDRDDSLRLRIDKDTFKADYLKLFIDGEEIPVTAAQLEQWGAKFDLSYVEDGYYDSETDKTYDTYWWSYTNLPAYDEKGEMITYVVKEMTVKGYQTFYVNGGYAAVEEKNDGIYADAVPPSSPSPNVIFNALAKGTLTIEKTVEVQGDVQPDTLPEFQFTITPAEGLTGYHFMDAQGKELTSPVTIAVEKKADGTITGTLPVTILFDSFDGTEKEFTFTVKETGTAPDGWTYDATEQTVTFTVMRNQSAFEPSDGLTMSQPVVVAVDSTSGGTASFTNTYKEEEKTSITVNKHWPTSEGINVSKYLFLCTLDADGKPVKLNPQPDPDNMPVYTTEKTADGDTLHRYTWSDLPKCDDKGNEIKYVVIEEGLEGYFASYENGSGGSDSYAGNGGVIVNRIAWDYFRISKDVDNYNGAKLPTDIAFNFTITPGEKNPGDCELRQIEFETGIETKLMPDEKGVYTVSLAADEWSNFGVYFPVVAGTYTFVVQEVVPSPLPDNWAYDTHTYTVTFEVADDGSVEMSQSGEDDDIFTNKYYGTTDLEITKYWEFDAAATRPVKPETFAQYLTLRYAEYPLDTEGDPVYDHEFSANEWKEYTGITPSVEVDDVIENEWVITYENLPNAIGGKEVTWSVVEKDIPGYTKDYDLDDEEGDSEQWAYDRITNTFEVTSVSVTKEWVGGEYDGTNEPVTLTLYANDAEVDAKPDVSDNVYTWSNLAKYDTNGELIVYTVKETAVPDGYTVTYLNEVGEDAGELVPGDAACDGGKIVNTYAAKGAIVLEGTKVLEGRTLKADEFSFELKDANGNVLQIKKNAQNGSIVFDEIEYTEADLSKSPIKYTISEVQGSESGMTYAANVAEVTVTLTDNGDGTIDAKVDKTKEEIEFVNTCEETVYEAKGKVEFDGVKILNGRDMKAGEFTFILTDKAGKELQRVTNAADGTFAFEPIKYTEKDVPYGKDAEFTYYITELAGDLPGVTYDTTKYEIVVGLWDDEKGTIHVGDISECVNEIVFTNTYEAEGAVTFKGAKFLLGREFKQGDEFTFELLNEKGDVIDTVTINPTSGTKADFAFKTIKYELADAGKTYTYTYRVKEKAGTEDGMIYDDTIHTVTVKVSDAGDGTLQVEASKTADELNFTNTYLAEGSVLFSGTKTMKGKALEGKDFTFVLTDADGKEIETVTNDKDGKIVFSTIQYKLEDAGKTFTYKVSEKNDGKKAVTYDNTVYTVTVKVEDDGNGHLKVTASDNATKLNFTNSYEAKAVLTMNAYKTVNGYKPSVNQVYDFVLLCDDGTEMKAQNKDEVITFGTIGFDEEDVGKTFIYTVKETTEANELLEVDTAIYQVAVTVIDNGDGNLKLETEILKDGKRANGVVFANTATATLAISKTVKGPGPDKAFDLKVTFIGVDGKELEGVYDYDGDVKGTITSGGVIALKDGQSVTIVGLPEGATYTVEENAGPAYTVTVNGKPIAKAEGTLVGHGKLEFINTVEVTTFSVTKVWEGTDLGEITLTLYADGKQITPQPEVTREGDKYTYYNLPKYNEEGEEIVYSAKERGIDGYIRIYNNVEPYQDVTSSVHDGGTIINREIQEEVHELSFKIHKVWTGVEATEEIPAITLTLYCNGEKLDVPTPKPDSEGWYRYYDLPKTVNGQIAVYTVVEEPIPGYTVTYKTASGEVVEEGVNGGEIINAKIPQTGDPATLGLWLALMGASAVLLTMLQRRRKA